MTKRLRNDASNENRCGVRELEDLHPDCFAWALCCCGHDRMEAEDVLQTAYLKVLEGRARYDGRAAFKTWLFGVIRHTALDWRRRAWRRWRRFVPLAGADAPVETASPPDADNLAAGHLAELRRALAALPPRQREVLCLVFYQELSLSEAASVLGITVGSARQHYQRGKARLRERLKPEQVYDE